MSDVDTDPGDSPLASVLSKAVATLTDDPLQAADHALSVLHDAPGQHHALMVFVSAHRIAGDLEGARAALQRLADAEPGLAAVQHELAMILIELGQTEAAIDALGRLVELEPAHPQAWRMLGDQLTKVGRPAPAGEAYGRHFEMRAREWEQLGRAAVVPHEDPQAAQRCLTEFLATYPTAVPVRRMLAEVYLSTGRRDDGQQQLELCLAHSPGYASARWMLALSYAQQSDWGKALAEVEILLIDDPLNENALNLKAHALLNTGAYERAVEAFETWVERRPSGDAWLFYGHALATVGRTPEGVAAFRKAIALEPQLAEAYWALSNLKTFRFASSEIEAMRSALASGALDARNRWLMNFALGKALEDIQDYPASFTCYREGNAAFRKGLRYSAESTSAFVRRSKALFTAEFFRQREGSGASAPDPIFIVGLPRSGSTLIEQILASHSMVEGTSELTALPTIVERLWSGDRPRQDAYPEPLRELTAEALQAAGQRYLERARLHRQLVRPHFIDKAPANFLHLGLLRLILPRARIIDARRHPLGCGFAVFRQYFPQAFPFAFDLAEIGRYYRDYVELMAHFDAVQPGRVHRVIYEQLVAEPEREIRRLLDYCELPFEQACLHFHETRRGVLTPSAEQVRQPLFTDALAQWRHYEPWLGPLKEALGDVLTAYPAVPTFPTRAPALGAVFGVSDQARQLNAMLQGRGIRR
jgi:tetratricopeptide (TPR) repeat protein